MKPIARDRAAFFRGGWRTACRGLAVAAMFAVAPAPLGAATPVDVAGYSAECGVEITHKDEQLHVGWPLDGGGRGGMTLDLRPGKPLIAALSSSPAGKSAAEPILHELDLVWFLTVGSRAVPPGKPASQAWEVFFDKPANRPHETHLSSLSLEAVQVTSRGKRATVSCRTLRIGSFAGALELTFYSGTPLVHAEAVVTTGEDRLAIIYDAGLSGESPGWRQATFVDSAGRPQGVATDARAASRIHAVRHRMIAVEGPAGAVAVFPPPHQFQFPRDWSNNYGNAFTGRDHLGTKSPFAVGIHQDKAGGGAFVPWFNAPPDVPHRLGLFLLAVAGKGDEALAAADRFTRGDRFPRLPGHLAFTSHWHMAIAVTAMQQQAQGKHPAVPDLVRVFKDMGVDMVHLAEFHGDGHQKDPGPLRLPEMEAMFAECRRLSDDELLLIPGEEVNTFLGLAEPGKHPGHWMSLFPGPVYWTMQRNGDEPFVETHPRYGKVYRVGSRGDMIRLLREERGLAWTAHPRIKASSWTPDIFRNEDFYLAEYWLGAAWKAMPADLSQPRLGKRCLDLLDDMSNWGTPKYLPGEVDVFKIDRTHELYGHMNINYLRLDKLPKFDDGWPEVLDALRRGAFFVTTGEVLIPEFQVGGAASGEAATLPADGRPDIRFKLSWTYPLAFAELVSGDGQNVFRERIDLARAGAFGEETLALRPELAGRRWVRLEAWDVAVNGAYTQPVWLLPAK